ncbi:MAG TPA: MlaD family protein [Longimicrobiales bacterium]|nr:MlaD family protein [Longimicrobiales bacterium]
MPTETTTDSRTRRGYLILIGIFVAALLIFNLKAISDLVRDDVVLVAILADASGVRVGTPVRVAGIESGRVLGVSFVPAGDTTEVALLVTIDGSALSVVRADSDVRAVRLRVIGQPVVQLEAGSPDAPTVESGDTLRARPRLDPAELLVRGRGLPAALDSLLEASRYVQEMATGRMPELERLGVRVAATMEAADALSADLEHGSFARMAGPGGALAGVARLRARLDEVTAALGPALARYAPGGADGNGELGGALRSLSARVTALQGDLDALSARMEEGGGVLDRLARDSALQVAIRGVQAQLDSLRQEGASIALRMMLP